MANAETAGTGKMRLNDWRIWAAVLLTIAVWQGVFWSVVHLAERAARPTIMSIEPSVNYQFVGAAADRNGESAIHVAPRGGAHGFNVLEKSDAPRLRFLLPFHISEPTTSLAIYLSVRNSVDLVRVNGEVAQSVGALPRLRGLVTSEPAFIAIPPEHVRVGANMVEVETPNIGAQWLSEYAIGAADVLADAYHWKNFLQTDIALAGVAIIAFTILLCLVVRWPREDRARINALVALLGLCGAATLLLTFSPPFGLTGVHVAFLFALFSVFIALAALAYVMVDWRLQGRWLQGVWVAGGLAATGVAIGYVWATTQGPLGDWIRYTVYASFWFFIACGVIAIAALAGALVRDRGARWFERSILAFCIAAFALDRFSTMVKIFSPFDASLPITLGWSNIVGGLLGLSLVVALAREAGEARRVVASANETLRAKLAERESELRESYTREHEGQKRAVLLEERQRLVRDMHDGIGGQLLGLSMQVRARQLDHEGVERVLNNSIADLRLIVDSLDAADDGLADALLAFEHRARADARAVNCQFVSDVAINPDDAMLGPRVTLQILRILQEAHANALRHAGAKRISLSAHAKADGSIEIVLRDDGQGIAPGASVGIGLQSMRARASAIGAQFAVNSDATGTRVSLVLGSIEHQPTLRAG